MATRTRDVDVDTRVTCSICLEPYKGRQPKLLTCHHTFCLQCLDHVALSQRSVCADMNADNNSRDDRPLVITCPTCRKESSVPPNGVAGFQTNFYIENLDQTKPCVCDLCSPETREAIAYCTDCERNICLQCFLQHDSYAEGHLIRLVSGKAKPEEASLKTTKVQEQLRIVEVMLGLLRKEQHALSRQARLAKDIIKARYSTNLMQLAAQAQEDCLGRLRADVEAQESRLRAEREDLQAKKTALMQMSSYQRHSQSSGLSTCSELLADLVNDENVRDLQQRLHSARHESLVTLENESSSLRLLASLQDFIGLVRPTRPGRQTRVQGTILDERVRKTSDPQVEYTHSASQQAPSSDTVSRDDNHHECMTSLATKMDDLATQVVELKTENSALKKELSTFRDSNLQLYAELRTLENKNSCLLQEVQSGKDKNALLSQDVTSLGEDNAQLRLDLSEVEKETSRLCQDLKSLQTECEKRHEGLNAVERGMGTLCEDMTSLQKKTSEIFQRLEKVENENSMLVQELGDVKEENSKLRRDVEQAEDDHSKLRQDLQLCLTVTADCRQDTSTGQALASHVQTELQRCVAQVGGLQQALSSVQSNVERADCKADDFMSWVKESIPTLQKNICCLQKEEREHSAKMHSLYKLMKQAKEVVAFHAVLDTERVLAAQQPLVVDHVLTNIGGGYNKRTGVFTAPVSGIYLFQVTTGSLQGRIRLDVVLNGARLAHSFALADSRTTCHAVAHVRLGGRVWLRSLDEEGSTTFDSGWVTTFTGCLLIGEPFRDKLTS